MDQSREYGQQYMNLPHDVVPLPSGGVFYKNKKSSVKVGYLTANDENILMGGSGDITTTLLRNKIYEPDLRVEDLLQGDVEAILIFLRNTSFGPEMTLNLVDPSTRKNFETNVLLDQMSIKQGMKPNEDGTFTITLPKSNSVAKIRPLTFGEANEIESMADSYPQGRIAPRVTWKLQRQIVELNGITDKGELSKEIERMPITDSKYIKNFLLENEPRLDLKKTVTAPSGEKLTVNVGFGVEFFRPFF
jgi:hypothetical protein